MKQIYNDIEKCKKDLLLAREKFGDINTTREQYDAMQRALAAMVMYCPENFKNHALATLKEAEYRRIYYEMKIWKL